MGCGGSKNQLNDPRSCFPLPVLKSPSDLISILPSLSIPPLNLQDYEILTPLASGGIGIVYSAQHKETKQYIALKFFGYVPKRVNLMELYHEFELFAAVNGFDGVVQLLGFGIDTPSGYIRNKVSKLSYPVICMEYLQGGDLFDRIQSRSRISEHDIALIFRNLIVSLIGLHKRGYIHCDIKLENIMFATSQANDFNVKFIDFGMMIQLPNGQSVYTSSTIHGTPGYVAPESLRYGQYSFQSDVWQVGCVLYSLLSGFQAFNPSHPEQIILGKYQKMTGIGWDNISNEAKDLLSKIFVLNPNKRLTCEEILTHAWLHAGIAPRADLGEHYHKRIKHLALGQTLKKVFQDRDMVQVTSDTKEKLKRILPLLLRPGEKKKIRRTRSSNMAPRPSLSSLLRSSSPLHPPLASPRPLPFPRTLPQPLPRQIDGTIISFNKKHSTPSIFVHAPPSPLAPVITQHYEQEQQLRAYAQDDIDLLLMARRRAQAEEENEITTTAAAVASSEHQEAWKAKMALLKTAFVHHASGSAHGQRPSLRSLGCRSNPPDDQTSIGEDGSAIAEEQSLGRHSGNGNGSGGEINFEAFVSLLLECDLSELATPQMFHIFGTPLTLLSLSSPPLSLASPVPHRHEQDRDDRPQGLPCHYDCFP
jgi:serine/threonine protein kinase